MPWLLRDREVLASVREATGPLARARGVLGRGDLQGVLLMRAPSVHTVGVGRPIDVAFCHPVEPVDAFGPAGADTHAAPDASGGSVVLCVGAVRTLAPRRVSRPRWRDRVVLEAEAGSFERWGVGPGDRLRVR